MSKKTRRRTPKLRRDESKDKEEERKKEKKRKEMDGSWVMVELCFIGKIII
jgi:exosome complex RNA-binding protein Rrp42 (RNase PH superfamily)